jgi:hypothetical protein
MGLSRHVIPVSPVVLILTFPILLHRSHHFRFCKFRNRIPLLFLRPRRRRCPSVLDRTDAGRQKAAIADRTVASRLGATRCIRSGWRCAAIASLLFRLRIYFSRAPFALIPVVFDIRLCALLSDRLYILRLRLYRGRCTHSPRIIQWNQSNAILCANLSSFLRWNTVTWERNWFIMLIYLSPTGIACYVQVIIEIYNLCAHVT